MKRKWLNSWRNMPRSCRILVSNTCKLESRIYVSMNIKVLFEKVGGRGAGGRNVANGKTRQGSAESRPVSHDVYLWFGHFQRVFGLRRG